MDEDDTGGEVTVAIGGKRLSEVDAYAARMASGRPEAIRQLLDAGLDAAEELDARLTEIEVGRPGDDEPEA